MTNANVDIKWLLAEIESLQNEEPEKLSKTDLAKIEDEIKVATDTMRQLVTTVRMMKRNLQ